MAEIYSSNSVGHFFLVFGLVFVVVGVISLVAWVKIITKAGYSGWWVLTALLGFIPFLGAVIVLVLFLVFAFSEWPIEHQLAMARGNRGGGYTPPVGGQWTTAATPGYPPPGYPPTGYPPTGYAAPTASPEPPPAYVPAPHPPSPDQPGSDPSGADAPIASPPSTGPPSRYLPSSSRTPPPGTGENDPPPPAPPPYSGGTV